MQPANPLNPQMAEHIELQAETWGPDFFWHQVRWMAVNDHLPADRSFGLVDVGAGAGFAGEFLSADHPAADYSFIEPVAELEAKLEQRWGTEANRKGATSFDDSHFVCMLDVLEHIEDDQAFLDDLAKKMAPEDRLIILVPALQSLWSQWDVSGGHFRRYDKAMIEALVTALPFEIEEQAYLFPEMLPAGWLRSWRSSRGKHLGDFNSPPSIPPWANRALTGVGAVTVRLRRAVPRGTSLMAVLKRT